MVIDALSEQVLVIVELVAQVYVVLHRQSVFESLNLLVLEHQSQQGLKGRVWYVILLDIELDQACLAPH